MNIEEMEKLRKELESIITHLQNDEKEQAINKLGYMSDNLEYDIKDMKESTRLSSIASRLDKSEKDEMFRK